MGYRKTATVSACDLLWADTMDLHLVLPAERTKNRKGTEKTKSRERWMGVPGILLVCLSVLLPGSCWLMHQVQGQVTVTVLDVGQEMESVSGCREERTV